MCKWKLEWTATELGVRCKQVLIMHDHLTPHMPRTKGPRWMDTVGERVNCLVSIIVITSLPGVCMGLGIGIGLS